MNQILGYLFQMLPPALLAAALFFATKSTRASRLADKGLLSSHLRERGLLVFVMFLAGLAALTLLPRIVWEDGRMLFLTAPGTGGVNLTPGRSLSMLRAFWRWGNLTAFSVNLWGNILMFAPIGFFIALLWDRPRWWKSTLITCGISLFIEICQLFVARGTDIDDLILNTVGGLLGYVCFMLLRHFFSAYTAKFSTRRTDHGPKARA